jgi:hypothetical protein
MTLGTCTVLGHVDGEKHRKALARIEELEAARTLRPMSAHKKDGTPVLARFRQDFADLASVRRELDRLAGLWVVVRHTGVHEDGWDPGWNLAGPFGYGGLPDEWFSGWMSLPE